MDRRTYLKQNGVLIGGIFFTGSLFAFLEGCKVEETLDWSPKILSPEDVVLVREFADVIIPASDTPGARDVGVEKRIDEALWCNYESPDQEQFVNGLHHIKNYCHETYNQPFLDLTTTEKKEVVSFLSQESNQERGPFVKHIYPLLKGLTVLSYFTSEKIAKEVLLYDPIPGNFSGDVPYDEVGGIWSLNNSDF